MNKTEMKFKPLLKAETEKSMRVFGVPHLSELDIPLCKDCSSKMTFIYDVLTTENLLLVFQCTANSGMCDDWDC